MSPKEINPRQIPMYLPDQVNKPQQAPTIYSFGKNETIFRWSRSYSVINPFQAVAESKKGRMWTFRATSPGIIYRDKNMTLSSGTKFQAAKRK